MATLSKVGFLGRVGLGGVSSVLKPIFAPDLLTLTDRFGGTPANAAIRNSTATVKDYLGVLQTMAIDQHRVQGARWTGTAWADDDGAGNTLFPKATIDGMSWYLTKPDWQAGVAYAAGAEVNYNGRWYSTPTGGTDVAAFGDTVTWVDQGPYSHDFGLLAEPSATNYFLQSDTPATQTISLAVGTYTLWLDGATGDSITSAAGTAAGTGFGAATPGTPNIFSITTAGTVTFTVAGTPIRAQVENSPVPTSYIPTTTAPITRAAETLAWDINGNFNNAQGTLVVEFVPASAKHAGAQRGIVSVGGSALSVSYIHGAAGDMYSFDGTNAAYNLVPYGAEPITKAVRWNAGTSEFQIGVLLKSQYGSAWSWGAVATYDGAFTLGVLIQLAVGMDEPIIYRNIAIYDRDLGTVGVERRFS